MKRILIVAVVSMLATGFLSGQALSGAYTVGGGGSPNYATLVAAVADLNANTASGPVTFNIMGDLAETDSVRISTTSGLTGSKTLTIRPGTGVKQTITFPPTKFLSTGGANQITIDSLIIKHTGTSSGNSVIWIEGLSDTITIKNCILGDATNTPDYAVKTSGSSGNKISNVTIQNNEIHGIGNSNAIIYFVHVQGTDSISGNSISGDQIGSAKAFGILLDNCSGTTTIEKNSFYSLKTSAGSGYKFAGIEELSTTSGNLNIYNNFIGGAFSSSSTSNCYLISLQGSATKKVYHNTLVMNSIAGAPADAGNLYVLGGTIDFKNNIVINNFDNVKSVCISEDFFFTPANLTSNYNVLYAPGTNNKIAFDGSGNFDPLSNWQGSAGSPDANSKEIAVAFVNSASNFHLQAPFVFGGDGDQLLTGTNLSASVSVDIDGEARRFGTQSGGTGPAGPYIGADESTNELPIQLAAITVAANRLDAVLRWSTATEVNNHGFEVERRSVGAREQGAMGAWEKVGFVSGTGTSTSPKDYSYVDAGLSAGRYAYRIKQVDNDGSFTYYLAAEVEVGVTEKVLALEANYPNPFNPSTNIAFSVPENGKVALKVFNLIGQEVAVLFDGIAEAGKLYQQSFDASQLPTGLYFSRLEFGGKSLMRKMLFVK